ncbi:MAG: hypothetical protein ACOC5M_04090 [Chloroflexota bacterium]
MLQNGSPHVVLADLDGRMRCGLWLGPNGNPSIAFFDEDGGRRWITPQDEE